MEENVRKSVVGTDRIDKRWDKEEKKRTGVGGCGCVDGVEGEEW